MWGVQTLVVHPGINHQVDTQGLLTCGPGAWSLGTLLQITEPSLEGPHHWTPPLADRGFLS